MYQLTDKMRKIIKIRARKTKYQIRREFYVDMELEDLEHDFYVIFAKCREDYKDKELDEVEFAKSVNTSISNKIKDIKKQLAKKMTSGELKTNSLDDPPAIRERVDKSREQEFDVRFKSVHAAMVRLNENVIELHGHATAMNDLTKLLVRLKGIDKGHWKGARFAKGKKQEFSSLIDTNEKASVAAETLLILGKHSYTKGKTNAVKHIMRHWPGRGNGVRKSQAYAIFNGIAEKFDWLLSKSDYSVASREYDRRKLNERFQRVEGGYDEEAVKELTYDEYWKQVKSGTDKKPRMRVRFPSKEAKNIYGRKIVEMAYEELDERLKRLFHRDRGLDISVTLDGKEIKKKR